MLRSEHFVKSQLALAAWREAHHYGGSNPMIMVACGLANRVRAGWGSWLQVIDQIPVFSAVNLDEQPTGQPDLMDPNVVHLLQAIDGIYDGNAQDLAAGGLYFCDLGKVTRLWFRENIMQKPHEHPRAAVSVAFQFYK